MAGIRIHHPTHKSCILLVPHPGEFRRGLRTYNKGRKPKEYRIELDSDGNCIVSETVWMRLQEAKAPFIVLNEVLDPPKQTLGFNDGTVEVPATYKQIADVVREIAPPGVKTYIRRT